MREIRFLFWLPYIVHPPRLSLDLLSLSLSFRDTRLASSVLYSSGLHLPSCWIDTFPPRLLGKTPLQSVRNATQTLSGVSPIFPFFLGRRKGPDRTSIPETPDRYGMTTTERYRAASYGTTATPSPEPLHRRRLCTPIAVRGRSLECVLEHPLYVPDLPCDPETGFKILSACLHFTYCNWLSPGKMQRLDA